MDPLKENGIIDEGENGITDEGDIGMENGAGGSMEIEGHGEGKLDILLFNREEEDGQNIINSFKSQMSSIGDLVNGTGKGRGGQVWLLKDGRNVVGGIGFIKQKGGGEMEFFWGKESLREKWGEILLNKVMDYFKISYYNGNELRFKIDVEDIFLGELMKSKGFLI